MKFLTNILRISSIIPLLETENDFIFIRSYLLNWPTSTEQQIATQKIKAVDSIRHDPTNDPLDQISLKLKSEWIEARLTTYKRDIHQLWDRTLKETPVVKTKLIVGNRNNPNATRTLVRCRPAKKLSDTALTNGETHWTEQIIHQTKSRHKLTPTLLFNKYCP
jgi:hypothetical protein